MIKSINDGNKPTKTLDKFNKGEYITATKLNQSIEAINRLKGNTSEIIQVKNKPVKPLLFVATENKDYDYDTIYAKRLLNFELNQTKAWGEDAIEYPKTTTHRIRKNDILAPVIIEAGHYALFPMKRPSDIEFRQEDGDMPDDGSSFPFTVITDEPITVYGAYVEKTTGTFSVIAQVNGTNAGTALIGTGETVYATPFDVDVDDKISLKVTSSSSCTEFMVRFLCINKIVEA